MRLPYGEMCFLDKPTQRFCGIYLGWDGAGSREKEGKSCTFIMICYRCEGKMGTATAEMEKMEGKFYLEGIIRIWCLIGYG